MAQRRQIACVFAKTTTPSITAGTPVYLNDYAKVHLSLVFAEIFAASGTRPNRTIPDTEFNYQPQFIACNSFAVRRSCSLNFDQPQHESRGWQIYLTRKNQSRMLGFSLFWWDKVVRSIPQSTQSWECSACQSILTAIFSRSSHLKDRIH